MNTLPAPRPVSKQSPAAQLPAAMAALSLAIAPAAYAVNAAWNTDASSGNGWENQALFGYDDRALSSMSWFSHR